MKKVLYSAGRPVKSWQQRTGIDLVCKQTTLVSPDVSGYHEIGTCCQHSSKTSK